MTGSGHVKEFTIMVGSDQQIRVSQKSENPGISTSGIEGMPIGSIVLDAVRHRTIKVLNKMLRESRLSNPEEFRVLGLNLYSVLFIEKLSGMLNRALEGKNVDFLRIRLTFEKGREELESWPWEYLFYQGTEHFIAEWPHSVLTRFINLENIDEVRNLHIDKYPVRILFVVASPNKLGPVQYKSVLDAINELKDAINKLGDGNDSHKIDKVEVSTLITEHKDYDGDNDYRRSPDYIPDATFDRFVKMNEAFEPHLIHFVGHGKYDSKGGQIAFMDEDSTVAWVQDNSLASELMNNKELRLVFLQACETAFTDPYNPQTISTISGVANYLAHENIPAVIAMRDEVENHTANLFATAFYEALRDFKPVDSALQEGRTTILQVLRKDRKVGRKDEAHKFAFGLPVLYLRGSGALLPRTRRKQKPGKYTPALTPPELYRGDSEQSLSSHGSCPSCRVPCDAGANFCGSCGFDLRKPSI